jgi:phage terminase large subunit-like protein
MTYSQERAAEINSKFRLIMDACGIQYRANSNTIKLDNGTTVKFTSGTKGLTGKPITGVLVVDDLYTEETARSKAHRMRIELMWPNSVVGRLHRGASVLVLGTRWHPDDWYGKLVKDHEYVELRLPALAEENDLNGREVGEALFPFLHTAEELAAKQRAMSADDWASLFQQRPRARGAGLFAQPTYYTALPAPSVGRKGAYGIDLAYTTDTRSDMSVCVEMWRVENPAAPKFPIFYVVGMWYDRCLIEVSAVHLRAAHDRAPGWPMCWRCSSTERASGQLLKGPSYQIPITIRTVQGDKRVNATEVAVAWNDGRVLLPDAVAFPQHREWMELLRDQCLDFVGDGKEHDDFVDALGNAHVELKSNVVFEFVTGKSKR